MLSSLSTAMLRTFKLALPSVKTASSMSISLLWM